MIPNLHPCFMDNGDVVAWDDEGRPLVLDRKRGRLALGHGELFHDDNFNVRQIMPGRGYTVVFNPGTPEQFTEPLLAWAVTADGNVIPIACDSTGETERIPPGSVVLTNDQVQWWLHEHPAPAKAQL